MFDSPVDQKIQAGLKVQAKLSAFAILSMLVKAENPPISTDKMKDLADVIYTCLYSCQYYKEGSSAEEFLKYYADDLRYADWEPELVGGVEVGFSIPNLVESHSLKLRDFQFFK